MLNGFNQLRAEVTDKSTAEQRRKNNERGLKPMKGKKLLAGILSVVMALCTMAISAFAENSTMSLPGDLPYFMTPDYNEIKPMSVYEP